MLKALSEPHRPICFKVCLSMPPTKWYVVPPGLRQPKVKPDPEMPSGSSPLLKTSDNDAFDQGHKTHLD
eukprot:589563-Karenia_brevis.AAC.1